MGFFKKIFRRKKGVPAEEDPRPPMAAEIAKRGSKDERISPQNKTQQVHRTGNNVRSPARVDNVNIKGAPSFTPTNVTSRDSNSSRDRDVDGIALSPTGQSRSSPRNQMNGQPASALNVHGKYHMNVRYEDNLNHSGSAGSPRSPRLSHQQLQQFDLLNDGRGPPSSMPGHSMYTMSTEVPRGQLQAMDDMNRSDASSSSFNLSTDAEDSEYETLRRRGVLPRSHRNPSTLDNSLMSAISGPAYSINTEDDRLFPALHTDDEMTAATSQSGNEVLPQVLPGLQAGLHRKPQPQPMPTEKEQGRTSVNRYVQPPPKSTNQANLFAMNNETADDLRAWAISPGSTPSNKDPTSAKSATSPNQMFAFDNPTSPRNNRANDGVSPRGSGPIDPPTTSANRSSAPRNFTSPKSNASSSNDGFSPDPDFATFVDFNAFGNNAFAQHTNSNNSSSRRETPVAWREEKKTSEMPPAKQTAFSQNFDEFDHAFGSPRETPQNSSTQYAHSSPGVDYSLSELLAQAKNKQRRGGSRTNTRSSRASSSSVNSAPAITASFLRQHHNLGRYSTGSDGFSSTNKDREGTSVTDIIQSLEATNQSRFKNGSRASYGHRSVGDTGAVSTARAVKERLREKRRKERELGLQTGRSSEGSSSENSDNEASESWLFDEVTGALGPRGIAADLESLSGRSNRSKNSQGNKSHRSHRSKSRRSRPSSTRRPKSSGDSVDSRGSRTSRNSRYSHRSTKSFLSQMSEQSRSVANDLLRLEMQLAMVGSGENRDDMPARTAGGSVSGTSVSGASRINRGPRKSHTRSQSSGQVSAISHATRRTKIDVLAPPGKLGIILANKADSKGTVVSGVRTSSVLADRIAPGDRIVAIDGEDVSRMTVSEITTIMSRKADYERILTVLTIPKQLEAYGGADGVVSPTEKSTNEMTMSFDNGFAQFRR